MGGRGLHIALLVHRRARRNTEGAGREAAEDTVPGEMSHGHECSRPSVVRWEVRGGPSRKHRAGSLGQHPPETAAPTRVFGQTAQKPAPGEQRSKRHSKQRKRPSAKGQGHQGSEVTAVSSRQPEEDKPRGADGLGGPFAPKGRAQSLLTSSRCWRWCWPRRPRPGRRAGGHSSRGRPRRSSASRGARRSGPARAAPRAAGTGTTG